MGEIDDKILLHFNNTISNVEKIKEFNVCMHFHNYFIYLVKNQNGNCYSHPLLSVTIYKLFFILRRLRNIN